MASGLQQVLLQQRDAVAEIVRTSQEFIDQPEHFSIKRLEELMKHRAGQVEIIEVLEAERARLLGDDNPVDSALQPLCGEIQGALNEVATLDDKIKGMVFEARLKLTNSMAFAPGFVNLRANVAREHNASSRVLDITR